jgi:uncharacterized protein YciI
MVDEEEMAAAAAATAAGQEYINEGVFTDVRLHAWLAHGWRPRARARSA